MAGPPKQAQRFSRLSLLTVLLTLGAVFPAAAEPRKAPISKEPIVVSLEADAQKLDPPAPTDGPSFLVVEHLYDRLVEFADEGTGVVPGLAQSWESTPDGLKWTFHLRDATFSDGSPVTSEAVKFTFERIINTDHPQHFPGIAWTTDLLGDWFTNIETPDSKTAVFNLNRPFVPLLQVLAMPPSSIVSPAYTIANGEEVVSRPLGSGPFVLQEWKRGAYIKLKARHDYWGGSPATETVFFQVQPDPNQALSGLRTGDTHLINTVKPQAVGDPRRLGKGELIELPVFSLGYVVINMAKPNLKDVRVRQAMNYAIDRQNICDVLLEGTSIPAYGISPPGMLGHVDKPEFQYSYDVEKALALMTEAGYSAEKPLKVVFHCFDEVRPYNTVGKRLAERLAADLKKINIDVELRQMDFRGFIEFVDQRTEHELGTIGWTSDTGDPDNFIYYLFGHPTNRSNYEAGPAREMMEAAQSEMDVEKRAALYAQAETIVLKDAPAIFINHPKWVKGVSKRLKGYAPHPIAGDRLFNAYLE
jgi:peptide/nickel transport system substrate-binding protein